MCPRKVRLLLRWTYVPLVLGLVSNHWQRSEACTTAVISGKVTADGRPILWKNRDTDEAKNEVICFADGKYRAIGVVNVGNHNSVYMGVNEAGLCIENSLSKDLADPDREPGRGNGWLMKLALQSCETVDEFETLLKETNVSRRSTTANFGVIDCKGGAAIFETGPNSFKKFDANNEADAPQGYIVRSNFATSAQNLPPDALPEQVLQTDVYSGLRYARAYSMLDHRAAGSVDISYVIRHMTRDMANEDGEPYPGTVCALDGRLPPQIATESTISRTTTVSAAVFHGVRAGEAPAMTTMWAFLGDPKFTIAVPCWVTNDSIADPLADPFGAEIGEISRTLRDWSLSINADVIRTEHLPGIWEDLWKLEDRLLASVEAARHRWSQGVFDPAQANALHHQSVADAMTAMQLASKEARYRRT